MPTILIKDDLRRSVEAATGGQMTVLYTATKQPTYMNVFYRQNLEDIDPELGTGVDPAFIVNGVEKSELFIGAYPGIVKNGELISLPGVDPAASRNFDSFLTAARACGPGFHLVTNAEWMAIARWCRKNGFLPRGNTYYGRSSDVPLETGRRVDGAATGTTTGTPRTLTGSGPMAWRHNNTAGGISDLCGNVWEWLAGYRIVDGEIQIIQNNDAAAHTIDLSKTSTLWKAIRASDGALVAPGTAGTLKYDGIVAGTTGAHGAPRLSDAVTVRHGTVGDDTHTPGYCSGSFEALSVKEGLNVPNIARILGIAPPGAGLGSDSIWVRNYGERLPLAGGYYSSGASAGVFARNLLYARAHVSGSVGARPAFFL
ncbi:SUMF1/EgtB/PvdO family nonheme iron enzyme [Pseudomonas aeruginosa]